MLIKRGQADAIQLVRSTVNLMLGAAGNEPTEVNATSILGIPPMVFVDDEGPEEQFLTEDEASQDIIVLITLSRYLCVISESSLLLSTSLLSELSSQLCAFMLLIIASSIGPWIHSCCCEAFSVVDHRLPQGNNTGYDFILGYFDTHNHKHN